MQLVINTPGSYLRKKEGNFLVKKDEETFEFSFRKAQSIMITTSCSKLYKLIGFLMLSH